jgi:hypothetical protein
MPVFTLMLTKRLLSFVFALLLLLWGGYGLYVDDLLIPPLFGKVVSNTPHPTYLMFSAFICGAMMLTSRVINHYEVKNSELAQPSFARYVGWFGGLLFAAALLLYFLLQFGQALMR